jgi:hypothetical protein
MQRRFSSITSITMSNAATGALTSSRVEQLDRRSSSTVAKRGTTTCTRCFSMSTTDTTKDMLKQVFHGFSSQGNEALNQSICKYAPKTAN